MACKGCHYAKKCLPFVYCSFVRFGIVTDRKARRYAENRVLLVC